MARIPRKPVKPADGPTKAQKVAAAEQVVREIKMAWEEWDGDNGGEYRVSVAPLSFTFNTRLVDGGWRKLVLNRGHAMRWHGGVRAGAQGQLLFVFLPEMNSMLTERKAELIEVPHADLDSAFGPGFSNFIAEMMGAKIEELITQALFTIDDVDVKQAEAKAPDPVVTIDMESMEDFGAWG